jgi:ABC-2 type transport system permease protein
MSTDSVIHDIGYQRYTGERLGAGYATRSLYVHGLRSIYGFGRSPKAKIFPWAIVAIFGAVAVIDIAIRAQSRNALMPISYLSFTDFPMTLLLLFFTSAAAPELVSRDLRNKVLPLYFSRPISRAQYAWAKFAALVTGLFALLAAPLTLIFVAGAFGLDTWRERGHEFNDYLGGLGGAAICAIFYASVGLFIASLLSRRMIASAAIVGWGLVSTAVGAIIAAILGHDSAGGAIGFGLGQMTATVGLKEWLFHIQGEFSGYGPVYLGLVVLVTALAALLLDLRYRKVSA